MCGVVGVWGGRCEPEIVANMANALIHRGPDDSGVWWDSLNSLSLAHRRLSVLDISTAGAQPMVSACGQYALIFNGEIYNHLEIRSKLESQLGLISWHGHSDTETLLIALSCWGVEKCLSDLSGMFAFAFWDKSKKTLYLARDRLGEKPLYYGHAGDSFIFGSQLKSFHEHPSFNSEVSRDSLNQYLRFNYVPSPLSIYKGTFKLPPAHFLVITNDGQNVSDPICYWRINGQVRERYSDLNDSLQSHVDELENVLSDAIRKQMIADVPLGVFLSGGYDSTMITALMQRYSTQPINSFSIGFDASKFNEAHHAKAVACHLGTNHTELYMTSQDAMSVVPLLSDIYDEPFADASQIPTFLLSQLARQNVTVSLSGDGGDELFCGYTRYAKGYEVWNNFRRLPSSVRGSISSLMKFSSSGLDYLQRALPDQMRMPLLGERLQKLSGALAYDDLISYYESLVSCNKYSEQLLVGPASKWSMLSKYEDVHLPNQQEQMMFWDMMTYLPDDILTKVDRASMAVSLEVRAPFLDHKLVEFAWMLPMDLKYRDGQGKWLLKQLLYKYVPRKIMERPKRGFSVPLKDWLRGSLRDWAESLIDESLLKQGGYLNPYPIRKMWAEHLNGRKDWHNQLWNILMFQAWLVGQKH